MLRPGDWVRLRDETQFDYPWEEIGMVLDVDKDAMKARIRFGQDEPWVSIWDLILIGHG